jgi:hypothetical protein
MVSPGPFGSGKQTPIITIRRRRLALVISPENADAAIGDHRHIIAPPPCAATNSGDLRTPTPETIRVVQMDPGPTPTLTTLTPA